jgi:hypothetical protein
MKLEIEVDGRVYTGKYRLERSVVSVISTLGQKSATKCVRSTRSIAEQLLREIIPAARSGSILTGANKTVPDRWPELQ